MTQHFFHLNCRNYISKKEYKEENGRKKADNKLYQPTKERKNDERKNDERKKEARKVYQTTITHNEEWDGTDHPRLFRRKYDEFS